MKKGFKNLNYAVFFNSNKCLPVRLACILLCNLFICQNGKKLKMSGTKFVKSKTGYKSEKTIYICEDCSDCNYKNKCIKGNNSKIPLEERTKKFETSKKFNRQRKEDLTRIITD